MLVWVGKQVAPDLACGCPAKAEGEKAYRAWFAAGKDARSPACATSYRRRLTADRFVTHFWEMSEERLKGSATALPGSREGVRALRGQGRGTRGRQALLRRVQSKKSEEAAIPATPAKPEGDALGRNRFRELLDARRIRGGRLLLPPPERIRAKRQESRP
jgi:hypothetical protein